MKTKNIIAQGAEAVIILDGKNIIKQRIKKSYRIPELDEKIRKLRTRNEAKILEKASQFVSIPKITKVDEKNKEIFMEFVDGKKLSEELDNFELKKQEEILFEIGKDISKLHNAGIIHGDLTTSNMIHTQNISKKGDEKKDKIYYIDFGLGFQNGKYEDKAVDIHLLKQALEARHFKNWEKLYKKFEEGYKKINSSESKKVIERLYAVEKRGRYKH